MGSERRCGEHLGEFYPFGRALSEGGVLWRDYEGKPLEDEKMRDKMRR